MVSWTASRSITMGRSTKLRAISSKAAGHEDAAIRSGTDDRLVVKPDDRNWMSVWPRRSRVGAGRVTDQFGNVRPFATGAIQLSSPAREIVGRIRFVEREGAWGPVLW